ncbi:MAG: transposase [Chloroflexi bacterium]|nr:transposase [Chloroflexota bacterium]
MHLFRSLKEVRQWIDGWIALYIHDRPHDALGGLPPAEYAALATLGTTSDL